MKFEDYPKNQLEFWDRFITEEACWDYLVKVRWPNGYECCVCGMQKAWLHNRRLFECSHCGHQASVTAGTVFHDSKQPLRIWFAAIWQMVSSRIGVSGQELQEALGFGSYRTAWAMLQKLRRAMIRPSRDRLKGVVEVDETYVGGEEAGRKGRGAITKSLIVVAVEVIKKKPGRVRFRCINNASAAELLKFTEDTIEPGSTIITDGWEGYSELKTKGFRHDIRKIAGSGKQAHELLPCVHLVDSLVKRWLLGTHQGAVSPKQLQHYLDEYAFRFNRRLSTHRGKLFFRLVEQCVVTTPHPYKTLVRPNKQQITRKAKSPESSA